MFIDDASIVPSYAYDKLWMLFIRKCNAYKEKVLNIAVIYDFSLDNLGDLDDLITQDLYK